MEEKESTVSASPGNSGSESPPAPISSIAPQVVNMEVDRSFGVTIIPATTTPVMGTASATPGSGQYGSSGTGDSTMKKKRGRPRKYDADGNLMLTYPSGGFSLSPSSPSEFQPKRGRGRPPGSGNWQLLASLGELFANTAGGDFTPHVVTVYTGEDVAGRILQFSQKGPRGICVLSANGAVSNVTLRQPGSSGGILTYEGRFEILSLTGSYTVVDTGGMRSRTGGLSVSLAGPDGRVIGGGVAGLLLAASPIQIVVGSFMPNGFKVQKRKQMREHAILSPVAGAQDPVTAARTLSQAKPDSESFSMTASPFAGPSNGQADCGIGDRQNLNIPTETPSWNSSEPTSEQRPSPDINISVSCGEY